MVDFDGQVGGLHIEQRRRALAQRCPGRRSSSGPKGEVRLVRLAELAVADSPKLPKRMVIQNPNITSTEMEVLPESVWVAAKEGDAQVVGAWLDGGAALTQT